MEESLDPYLCPEQVSQSKCSQPATPQAKQTKKHDYEQDEIANKHRDEGCHIASYVEVTAVLVWVPRGADLLMDEHKYSFEMRLAPHLACT